MKKQILIILAIFLSVALYYVSQDLNRIVVPDIKYNTLYTSEYKDSKFDRINQSMNKADVISEIGEPFSTINPEFEHSILYTTQNLEIAPEGLVISIKDTAKHLRFLRINFNERDQIENVYHEGEFIDSNTISKLLVLNYDSIIKTLGEPRQEFKCDCNCSVLIYSKLKEGKYSGKIPTIANKRIALDENDKVKIIVDEVGNPYRDQLGICKTLKSGD